MKSRLAAAALAALASFATPLTAVTLPPIAAGPAEPYREATQFFCNASTDCIWSSRRVHYLAQGPPARSLTRRLTSNDSRKLFWD